MTNRTWSKLASAAVGTLTLGSTFLWAQSEADPPVRVARLSYFSGNASVLAQAAGPDWAPAQVNLPLANGDQLWTEADARAELQLGTAAIRFRGETNASFTAFDDLFVQIRLNSGGLNIHVRDMIAREAYEVDTPNVAFTILKPGDYRIQLTQMGTRVIVRSGMAEIAGSDRVLPLRPGDMVEITGFDSLSYSLTSAPAPDKFDNWSAERDQKQDHFPSERYTTPDMIGAADLDLYGTWSENPDFGPYWTPTGVDPNWAPYTDGHWVFMTPWGWVWIDAAPWGFGPSHYGRWVIVSGNWVWVPGNVVTRPVWSPALVAWLSGGGIVGVGWFPLGPREPYNPGYRASPTYISRINGPNYSRPNIPYANRNRAVSMSNADMAAGRPVRQVASRVDPKLVDQARITEVVPDRPAVVPRTTTAAVAQPPQNVASRPVIVRNPLGSAAPATATPIRRPAPAPVPAPVSLPGPPTVGERVDGPVRARRPATDVDVPGPTGSPVMVREQRRTAAPATTPEQPPPQQRMERAVTPDRRPIADTAPPQVSAPVERAEPRRAVEPPRPMPQIQVPPVPHVEPPRREVEAPRAAPATTPSPAPAPKTETPKAEDKKDSKKN